MNLLLDTHIVLWALNDDPALSARARQLILDPDNTVYYSVLSVWEVALNHRRRPQEIPFDENDLVEACRSAGFEPLTLSEEHVLGVQSLSRPEGAREHHDPFDRLLLAQAKAERMAFLTHDELIQGYGERCVIPV